MARYRHSSSIIGNSLFVFGGIGTNQQKFNDLHEYNFDCRKWIYIESMGTKPSARTFHTSVSY